MDKQDNNDLELYESIQEIPQEFRCEQSSPGMWKLPKNQILLGVKKCASMGWTEVSKIEVPPEGFQFYLGSNHPNVFRAYVNSSFPKKVTDLFIGNSTEDYSTLGSSFSDQNDYSQITEIISKGSYPELKAFSYETSKLFCNGNGLNGSVGDITELLKKMPNLESLEIGGFFTLSEPIILPKLKVLTVITIAIESLPLAKEPTETTFKNLFESDFPLLKEIEMDVDGENSFERKTNYSFPTKFLDGLSTPSLESLELRGLFKKGENQRLRNSEVWKGCHRTPCKIEEAYFLAIDVHYEGDTAFVCGIVFSDHTQTEPDKVYYSELTVSSDYEAGEFYKRELPCIIKLIEEHELFPKVIIVDGFSYLDNNRRAGLGAHLYKYLGQQDKYVSVIGVAKNPMTDTPEEWKVFRGDSLKPLYVKAIDLDDRFSRDIVSNMSGAHRIPTLLKLVDRLCREKACAEN